MDICSSNYKKDNALILRTNSFKTIFDSSVTIKTTGGNLGYKKNDYRGYFIVKEIADKGFYLINHLEIEEYLQDVVPKATGRKKAPTP